MEIGNFIRDSWGFIYNKVLNIFGWARELNWNPTATVLNWLSVVAPWIRDFIYNPSGFIYDRVKNNNANIYVLLTDPVRWFKEKLCILLGMSSYELDVFIPSLIRRGFSAVLSNQAGLLDYVQEALVNLVLRFI